MLRLFSRFLLCGAAVAWPMVGWDAYRSYDLHQLRPGEVTRQFSSYDRTGGNDDGGAGTYSCLRIDDSGRCVIAEANGPGQISSIWFTFNPTSVTPIGTIQVTLDNTTVFSASLQDLVNGVLGRPFLWPFVGNTSDTNGGNVIKVPMPYQDNMLVTTESNPHYYHVVYRTFPAGTSVERFDPEDGVDDIFAFYKDFGVKDPKPLRGDTAIRRVSSSLAPGSSTDVNLASNECGTVIQLSLHIPEIPSGSDITAEGRAFGLSGGESFKLPLDSNTLNCTLTRRIDRSVGNQVLSVSIDGSPAGSMISGSGRSGIWQDVVLPLPPNLTIGKTSIEIETGFVSSDFDLNTFGYALHCLPKDSGGWTDKSYGPSNTWTLMDHLPVGPSNIHHEASHSYSIRNQTWQGLRSFQYSNSDHDSALSSSLLLSTLVSMTFDGKMSVNGVPLGSLFGTSMEKSDVRSLLFGVDGMRVDGKYRMFFPMPFASSAILTLSNNSTGTTITPTIEWSISSNCPDPLDGAGTIWGHFSAQHKRSQTTPNVSWPILSTLGPGVAYGNTHTFRGSIIPGNPSNEPPLQFMEGDLQVFVNTTSPPSDGSGINSSLATMLGTGTEDFYESGWFFTYTNPSPISGDPASATAVPFAMPLTGLVSHVVEQSSVGCLGECVDAHRLMVSDSMAFGGEGIGVNIEHGPVENDVPAEYETCAFYYA